MVIDGKVTMQDSDHDADLYELTIDYLSQNKFVQYEVSNFCLPGFECKHNNAYWRYKEYLGFGTSAHSFVNGKRWWNYSSLNFYLEKMNNDNPVAGGETLTSEQMQEEYFMLAMRSKGLDINEYKNRFGNDWLEEKKDEIDKYEADGFLVIENNFIKFTSQGYALCDEIIAKLL
jgi:oxygen-independent coproporphyrinogen-3 oxidase